METALAIVIGGLYASGIYLMLQRSLVKLVIGMAHQDEAQAQATIALIDAILLTGPE